MKISKVLRALKELETAIAEVQEQLGPAYPERWEVGMVVEYLENSEWSWGEGTRGVINELGDLCAETPGSGYQVFWTHPIGPDGKVNKGYTWWTTPDDVVWIRDPEG